MNPKSNFRVLRRLVGGSLAAGAVIVAFTLYTIPRSTVDRVRESGGTVAHQYGQSETEWRRFLESMTPEQRARVERKAAKPPKPYTNPDAAQRYFLEQRTGGAPLDYSLIAEAKREIARMPLAAATSSGFRLNGRLRAPGSRGAVNIDAWTELGPGNIGGRTRSLIIDPANIQIMYVGGVAGGVWKTTNGGQFWAPLDDLMDNLAVTSLVFAGQGGFNINTSILYAGTGEGFFNGDAIRGAGIFKSVDAGGTWTQLPATANSSFYFVNKIVASPNDVNTLYAATNSGLWKTTDAGATWVLALDTGARTLDVEIRTDTNPDTLIVDSSVRDIFRSTDAGASWTLVFTHPSKGRADLAIAPSDQNTMYALVADNSNGARLLNVYRSTDGGATWSPRISGSFDSNVLSWLLLSNPLFPPFGQGWYDNIIAVAPHNPNIVFAGGIDLFRSDDGGATWGQISYWWKNPTNSQYAHADNHSIQFDPGWNGSSNQTLIVANDGGMQRTANALAVRDLTGNTSTSAVSWSLLNNSYGVTQFYHGRPFPAGATTYLGGTQDNGTLFGSDGAGINGWIEIFGGDGGYVSYSRTNTNVLFAETTGLSIRRSTNGGVSFSNIANNVIASGFSFITPFRQDPGNDDIIWIGGDRAWRSTNATSATSASSVNWQQASAPIGGAASAFAIDPADSDNVWMGLSGLVFHTSIATTATESTVWANQTPPGFFGAVSWIEVDQNDTTGNTAYFTSSTFNGAGGNVFKTTNRGASWTDITSNLPDIPVNCVVVQSGFPDNVFVGTDLGVFVSQNGGVTWAGMNTGGFANVTVETMEFQDANTLYAFTHGRGVFRAAVTALSGDDLTVSGGTFVSSGPLGGPFSPACKAYTLRNVGATALNWTAGVNATWLSVAPSSGSLAPGATVTVNVCLTSAANGLPGGNSSATVTFTNIGSGAKRQIAAILSIERPIVAQYTMDSNPGWLSEGEWAFGTPQGNAGDPTSGKTGTNVLGYNLAGAYQNNLSEMRLMSTVIDLRGITQTELIFWRWLGIESSIFDSAKVQVSNDGATWVDVWVHTTGDIADTQWVKQTFDISAVADNQATVFIRWVMGATDINVTFSGWNIDDVEIRGVSTPLSEAWVDFAHTGAESGSQSAPYNSIAEAVGALVDDGSGVIKIKGDTAQPSSNETPTLQKPMTIQSVNGATRIGGP